MKACLRSFFVAANAASLPIAATGRAHMDCYRSARRLPVLPLVVALGFAASGHARADALAQRTNRGLVEVITGNVDTTSLRIVTDISDLLDDGATRRILPVVGKGSVQNVTDLRALRGIDLAIVQTDVLDEIRRTGLYRGIESNLSYVAKLHNEEFHLLAAPNIRDVSDLSGKKVNFGVSGDGAAVTASAVFDSLRIKVEPTAYDPALALTKLRAGEIAAIAAVTGKPAPYFAALDSKDGLHLLPIPFTADVVTKYVPTRLSADDYPNLVSAREPIDTIAVGSVLLVANLPPDSDRYRNVAQFVDAFFTQFAKLLEPPRHPKWREINLASDMPGWKRFPPAEAWLKRNSATASNTPNEAQMREIFARFLDERSRAATGKAMSAEEKDELFQQFRQWQSTQLR
jgi:TRAP transporter TAXI family solute receptor